jgi:transmembrane sensor
MGEADDRVSAWLRARQIAPVWDVERIEGNLARTRARIRRRARAARIAGGVGILVVCLVPAIFFGHLRAQPPAPNRSADVVDETRTVHFKDGSSVRLVDAASHMDVGSVSDDGIDVTLRTGAGHFDVTPRPSRRFVVHAGIVDVVVVGTSFDVTRAESRVHVAVDRGRVQVRFAGGEKLLSAGESAWFPPPSEPAIAQEPMPAHVAPAGSNAVVTDSPGPATATELMAAADAARLTKHWGVAAGYLERLTREFPNDSRAPLAAFTLGRLLMSQPGRLEQAASAFALSRRLAPDGPLAEDALAREAEAADLSGNDDRVRILSEEYARRYPNGRHLESFRQRRKDE